MKEFVRMGFVAVAMALAVNAAAQETIKIGLIQPMTGSVAYNGMADINGSKLAVEQRNKAGGVLGKKVELVIEDGQCKPANSVNALEKLVQKDKVVAISGAFCSSATAAIMPLADRYRIPLITGVSSKADLTEKGLKFFFRAAETEALLAEAFSRILVSELKTKTVAFIGVNDDWGRGGVEEFSKNLEAMGVKTVMKEYFDHGSTDFYTLLAKVRMAKPDGVFVAAETQDGSILVKQFKELGIQSKIFGVGSWATADFIGLTGAASEGIYAAVPYVSTLPGARNTAFVDAYRTTYKEAPGKYGAAGYNALNILMDAIARANSTDADKLRDALSKTDYAAPNGQYKFNAKGQAHGFDVVLVQIQNKEPKVIATAPMVAK